MYTYLSLDTELQTLKIIYSDYNITVTPQADKVRMFTRQISDT